MNTDLAALRELVALAEKATPGEWHRCVYPDGKPSDYLRTAHTTGIPGNSSTAYKGIGNIERADDLFFIAAARNAMPALSRLLEAQVGWQPIETAPKDGKNVLLSYLNRADKRRTVIGFFGAIELEDGDDGELTGETWWESTWGGDYGTANPVEAYPTHWMPLPHPPSEREQT